MNSKFVAFLNSYWNSILIIFLVGIFLYIRLFTYGDLRLSIGTNDTPSYLKATEKSLFSVDIFTRQRLLTTTILYKLSIPQDDYQLLAINSPAAADQNPNRLIQPGFEWTVIMQVVISIISWLVLVLVFARHIRHLVLRVGAVIVLLLFAFMPQIADWDSILTSESLSISLFALSYALLIELVFWFSQHYTKNTQNKVWALIALWVLVFIFFVFTRDSNLYLVIVTILLLLPFLPKIVRDRKYALLAVGGFLIAILILGYVSSQQSGRWKIPISHVYSERILPYKLRVTFMQANGMPDPANPEFDQWFDEYAPATYLKFLINHPGYALSPLLINMELFFSENVQPYFIDPRIRFRSWYLAIGNLIHPTSSAVFFIDILLLGFLWLHYFKGQTRLQLAWALLGSWLFLSACATLFIGYHSDSIGVVRHVLGSVLYYRLFMWLFLFVAFDLSLSLSPLDVDSNYSVRIVE